MTLLINITDCNLPDHSILHWQIKVDNVTVNNETNREQSNQTCKVRPKRTINGEWLSQNLRTLECIENNLNTDSVNNLYTKFCTVIPPKSSSSDSRLAGASNKHFHKTWWNTDLANKLKHVRTSMKNWLDDRSAAKRHEYVRIQKEFDSMVRKAKRKDQALQRSQLLSLQTTDTRFFWQKIKQLDIDESSMIPWQVKTNNHVEADKEKVLGFWRNSFDKIYNRTVCDHAYGNVDYCFSYSLIQHNSLLLMPIIMTLI